MTPSPEQSQSQADKSSGQQPALVVDLRKMKKSLSWQNAGQVLVVLAALWAVYRFGFAALVGPAIADSPKVQQLDLRVTALEGGQSDLRNLAIRQLEEQRAVGEWIALGRRSPILDAPLPARTGITILGEPVARDGGR